MEKFAFQKFILILGRRICRDNCECGKDIWETIEEVQAGNDVIWKGGAEVGLETTAQRQMIFRNQIFGYKVGDTG